MLSLRSANWLLEMHYLPARIQQKQIKRMPYQTEHQENTSHESIEFSTLAKTCTKFTTKQKTKCSETQPMARIQCFAIRICCGWVDIYLCDVRTTNLSLDSKNFCRWFSPHDYDNIKLLFDGESIRCACIYCDWRRAVLAVVLVAAVAALQATPAPSASLYKTLLLHFAQRKVNFLSRCFVGLALLFYKMLFEWKLKCSLHFLSIKFLLVFLHILFNTIDCSFSTITALWILVENWPFAIKINSRERELVQCTLKCLTTLVLPDKCSTWISFDCFEDSATKRQSEKMVELDKKMTNEASRITEKCDQINKIYGCAA